MISYADDGTVHGIYLFAEFGSIEGVNRIASLPPTPSSSNPPALRNNTAQRKMKMMKNK